MEAITMEDIMGSTFGESSNKIRVTFKKTILVRSYETEVIEATSEVEVDETITGIERMFISTLLSIQMEYSAYCNLAAKGIITEKQLKERKEELVNNAFSIKYKADTLLGEGKIDKYITGIGK